MKWLLNKIETVTPYALEVALFGILFIVLMSLFQRKKIHASDIASFATTTGIFFTFLGIVIALGGLDNLDVRAIQQKLNTLLSGIFVAFIPSIFGAAIAVWTHIHPKFWCKPIEDDPEKEETDIDAKILQELRKLNKNLVGDSDTSLTTRLEKFQLKVTENQDALRQEFQEFSKNVAENIIEALKESMASLNEKLGEQFGENFRQFAEVIPKLLEWQENYRETIESTQQQLRSQSDHLNQLLKSLDQTQHAFTKIAEHAEGIVGFSNSIDQSMQAITTSFTESAEGMKKMSADAEKFQSSIESLTTHIDKQTDLITKQMTTLEQSTTSMAALVSKASILLESLNQTQHALGKIADHAEGIVGFSNNIDQSMQTITTSFTESAEGMKKMSTDAEKFQSSIESLTTHIDKQTDLITKQMTTLDQSTTSLVTLANKASILDDTTQQLNKLVNEMTKAISAITSGLGSVERLSDTLQGKAESIEQNMNDLTEETLIALASKLRGISEALVKDYQSVHDVIKEIKEQHNEIL